MEKIFWATFSQLKKITFIFPVLTLWEKIIWTAKRSKKFSNQHTNKKILTIHWYTEIVKAMYTIRKKGQAALCIMVDTNLIRSSVFRVGLQDRFKQYHRMHTHQVTAYYYNLYNIDVVFTIFLLQIMVSFVIIRCLISYILCAPPFFSLWRKTYVLLIQFTVQLLYLYFFKTNGFN